MSPTPLGVTVVATKADGSTQDVTEGVQALYDLVISSMDWGSGFLTVEDAVPVAELARFCGFERHEEADRYVEVARYEEQRLAERRAAREPWQGEDVSAVIEEMQRRQDTGL